MNRAAAAMLGMAITAVFSATAAASTVGIDATTGYTVFRSGGIAADASTVGTYTFRDAAATLKAGPGCAVTPDGVTCQRTGVQQFLLGGGDDRLSAISRLASSVLVEGGRGVDGISVDAAAWTSVSGGPDGDTVRVNSGSTTEARGDGGADHLLGLGTSTALWGGDGDDLVVASAAGTISNQVIGDTGDDQLVLVAGKATADGGAGSDVIVVLDNASITGPHLSGGGGSDTISSPARWAVVSAGGGADVVDVHGRVNDGSQPVDTVECGDGTDVAYADPGDTISADCEKVRYAPAPALAAVTAAVDHYAETFGE